MNAAPLVSVVIPVFNAEKTIENSLWSVFNQSYRNLEIIAVNDGSTDKSEQILQSLNDPRFKVVSQRNRGASTARNEGLKNSTGEFIQFLDADDLLHLEKISKQVALASEAEKNSIVLCNTGYFFDGDDPDFFKKYPPQDIYHFFDQPERFLLDLYGGSGKPNMVQPNAWLIPHNVVEKAGMWDEALTLDDDGEYFCRIVLASTRILYVNETLNFYRKYRNQHSLSTPNERQKMESQIMALQLKRAYLSAYENRETFKKAFSHQYSSLEVKLYPNYPDLYRRVRQEREQLGLRFTMPGIGSNLTNKLARSLDWRLIRMIQEAKKSLLR
ncbi:MAG: glycosyltransferase family 2 protein [Lewinellaceae bacterium]|nr:glycosyltransferase family 2 protein [Lewinellaceae bacterium]